MKGASPASTKRGDSPDLSAGRQRAYNYSKTMPVAGERKDKQQGTETVSLYTYSTPLQDIRPNHDVLPSIFHRRDHPFPPTCSSSQESLMHKDFSPFESARYWSRPTTQLGPSTHGL